MPLSTTTPVPASSAAPAPAATRATPRDGLAVENPIEGVYRGASDHRKDGQAAGW
jgi:hypothetical protein